MSEVQNQDRIDLNELTNMDLRDEVTAHLDCAAARVTLHGHAEALEVLYFESAGRAGIAWGGSASWTDADSIDDAIRRWLNDDMIP